jgi:uncharacterized Zn finger protein
MKRRDYGYYEEPSLPLRAEGGIKARAQRGAFGQHWWARQWLAVLEGFNLGARLGRGRSYARKGQVLSIDVGAGAVTAAVQGSRPQPYRVRIAVRTLSADEWVRVAGVLAVQAAFTARLLAGEMPEAIEEAFQGAGLSLFPARIQDLTTDCSCPDWSNPCKHIAAVYYLLGEEFDRDPFLIFQMRGMSRQELMGLLIPPDPAMAQEEGATAAYDPPSADARAFWEGASHAGLTQPEAEIPALAAALPKQLGPFPFWQGREPLLPQLELVYTRASATTHQ